MSQFQLLASPALGNSRLLSFYRLALARGARVELGTAGHEHVVDVLSGVCRFTITESSGARHELRDVGGREDIFSGRPEMVYIPREATYVVEAVRGPVEAAIYAAPAGTDSHPLYVPQDRVSVVQSGRSDWARQVYIGLGADSPATNIMVGETDSPPGNWSSFPPHRHMQDRPPAEHAYEELYYLKFRPSQGFAVGGTYHDPDDRPGSARLALVEDSQVFAVPSGYHFIAPAPGYRLCYTWALGGAGKRFGAWLADPAHDWLNRP